MREQLSCFIIAHNEARRIGDAIRSVQGLADEIVVVDSGSTDDTVAVAEALGARVVHHAWCGFGAQKRFAESICSNSWVLNIDADERITPEFAEEVRQVLSVSPFQSAFFVPVNIVYPGKSHPRPFPRDHFAIRLYDKRRASFSTSPMHDSVLVNNGSTGSFSAPILHHPFQSFAELNCKIKRRARYLADLRRKNMSLPVILLRLLIEFPMSFVRYYVVRTHVLGGLSGLRYATYNSKFRWLRVWYMLTDPVKPTTEASVVVGEQKFRQLAHG